MFKKTHKKTTFLFSLPLQLTMLFLSYFLQFAPQNIHQWLD